jgi:hypothetical protein
MAIMFLLVIQDSSSEKFDATKHWLQDKISRRISGCGVGVFV